jgi:uncharacterized protein YbjT (DUF2867 family)
MITVLVCGANGFIGAALCAALTRAGYTVIKGVRHPAMTDEVTIDYAQSIDIQAWLPKLTGIDIVINAVGIRVEHHAQRFEVMHHDAPIALFSACAAAGTHRIVQISALGAQRGDTPYFSSKLAADTFLQTLSVNWQIVRPALVYGTAGASAAFFRQLASLPVHFLPAGGKQLLQPIHIDDLVAAVIKLLDPAQPVRQCIELVGATRVSYRDMLYVYRAAMQFPDALPFYIPAPLMRFAAALLDHVPGSMLTRSTWKMLQDGNIGDTAQTSALLGYPPRGIKDFIRAENADALRNSALAAWRSPLLRVSLAFVWIATAIVSAFVYPVHESLALLARVGLTGKIACAALYGAAALDGVFGILTLLRPSCRLWVLQAGLVLTYSLLIGCALPEFLSHPFGPIVKNVPILAILFLLIAEDTRR